MLRKGKIRRPAAEGAHLRRPGLARLLDRIPEHALSLLCAPAGSGKSTAVTEWAASSPLPVVWLSLDAEDADFARLMEHVIAALRTIAPEVGASAEALLTAGALPTPGDAAAALADDLEDHGEPVVLVLENYDQVPGRHVDDFIAHLLDPAPPCLHVVVVSRVEPSLPLSALRGRGRLHEIRYRDLALTTAETRAFLEAVSGCSVTDAQLEAIHERFRGWAAGLRLLALSLRRNRDPAAVVDGLPRGLPQVEAYLRAEVFEQEPPELQQHLMRWSLLDRFTGALCDALAPEASDKALASDFLAQEDAQRVFVERIEGSWLRLAPAFRDFLAGQLQARFDPPAIEELHDRAAGWLDANGHVAQAVQHALRGKDVRSAGRILASHRVGLLNEGRIGELVYLASLLPEEAFTGDLDTLVLRGWAVPAPLLAEAVAEIEAALEAGDASQQRSEEIRGEIRFLQAAGGFSSALEQRPDLSFIATCAAEALAALPRTFREARAGAAHLLAQSQQMSGDMAGALATIEAAEEEQVLAGGEPLTTVRFARTLAYYAEADLPEALDAAATCLASAPSSPGQTPWVVDARLMQARIHIAWNELDEAERVLLHPQLGSSVDGQGLLVKVLDATGRSDEARTTSDTLLTCPENAVEPVRLTRAHAVAAELALHQGRLDEALDWARSARPDRIRPFPHAPAAMATKAWILTMGGEEHRSLARAAVNDLKTVGTALHNRLALITAHALEALLCRAEDDRAAAEAALTRSLALAAPGRFVRLYLDAGREMYGLLLHLVAPPGLEGYLQRLRSAFRSDGPQPARRANDELLDPLTDRELEVLSHLAQRLANKEIAGQLHISVATVKKHVATINQKLHVHRRQDAVSKALELGIVS